MLINLQNPVFFLTICILARFISIFEIQLNNTIIFILSILIIFYMDPSSLIVILIGIIIVYLHYKYKNLYFSIWSCILILFIYKSKILMNIVYSINDPFINYIMLTNLHNKDIPSGVSFYLLSICALLINNNYYYNFKNTISTAVFFPHILAGPVLFKNIKIKKNFLMTGPGYSALFFCLGMFLLNSGDNLYKIFNNEDISRHSNAYIRSWIYYLYLYANFFGYSILATAYAMLFGIEIPVNFNAPSLSKSPSDFWVRWHRSLSLLFRNYLFKFLIRKNINIYIIILLITFLSGLWHGWGFNFILWGFLNGILIIIFKSFDDSILKRLITFFIMPATWVPFYCNNFEQIINEYNNYLVFDYKYNLISMKLFITLLVIFLLSMTPYEYIVKVIANSKIINNNPYVDHKLKYINTRYEYLITLISGIIFAVIYSYSIGTSTDFIYQRF
jgi:alginate O-acetyltransferase complex protein AlgI